MVKISEKWDELLSGLFSSESYLSLREFLKKEYSTRTIYPSMFDILVLSNTCPVLHSMKVLWKVEAWTSRPRFFPPCGTILPISTLLLSCVSERK